MDDLGAEQERKRAMTVVRQPGRQSEARGEWAEVRWQDIYLDNGNRRLEMMIQCLVQVQVPVPDTRAHPGGREP